jgi:hypothetical protein
MDRRRRTRAAARLVGCVALLTGGLTGCGNEPGATPDESTEPDPGADTTVSAVSMTMVAAGADQRWHLDRGTSAQGRR